jgi:putative membrane-bound dehydrogenase-like protein
MHAPLTAMLLGNRRRRGSLLGAVLGVVAAVAACSPRRSADSAPPSAAERRIEVLFLGQQGNTLHNADRFAPMLKAALAPEGINFTYSTDPNDLNPATLAPYDALILYANFDTIAASQERALLDFVADGKGFLPIHSASYCFRNSARYVALVGAQFKSHGGEEFTAEMVQSQHPVLEGIQPFRVWDETYVHEKHNPDRTVLMERVDSTGREPWAWTRTHGRGRVFYTAYGHGEQTWSHPSFHRLLRNAILWAVGPEARQQLERLGLQPLRYADAPVPIPNYEKREPAPRYQEPLEPEEALKHFQVPPGFEVRLFAAEPDIVNPLAMAWDERGRLWVVESVDYPNNKQPPGQGNDAIKILADTNGDGRADRVTVFAEKLSIPTGLVLVNGGVVVAQAPEFLFLKDTTGDDRADLREVIMTGWRVDDTHAGPSNLRYGFDNWLWGAVGYAGFEGMIGDQLHEVDAGLYRFTPDGRRFEPLARFTNNTWGLGFSEAFDVFGSTANDEHSTYLGIPLRSYADVKGLHGDGRKKIDGHYALHPNTAKVRQVDVQGGFTAAAGFSIYTARSFPPEYWNRIGFVNEPTAHLVHRAVLRRDGAGYAEADGWNLLASDDEWFAPIQTEVGPDGAVWVLDWYHFIVQHNPTPDGFKEGKGNAYETPLRESRRGRVYRVVWKGAPPYRPASFSKDRPQELMAALRHDNLFWRLTAQRLLVERGRTDVLPELYAMAADRSIDTVGLNSAVVHALWTLHGLGAVSDSNPRGLELVHRALTHPSAGVRRNALTMLPRNEVAIPEVLRAGLLEDPDLNVRLTALLTLAELPRSRTAGQAIYQMSGDSAVNADEWLSEAVFIAATRHADGFLTAYADDIGMVEFVRIAARAPAGETDSFPNFSAPTLDDGGWDTAELQALAFEPPSDAWARVTWVRRAFTLPRRAEGQAAVLRLGTMRNDDVTYVNGIRIGGSSHWEPRLREYTVPPGVLVHGRNVLAVRVMDVAQGEPLPPDSAGMFLGGDGFVVPLSTGAWNIKVTETRRSGDRRRGVFAGIPIAEQFLAHNSPLLSLRRLAGPPPAAVVSLAAGASAPAAATVRIGVASGKLRFDRATVTAKAGQPLEIVFTNTARDVPHNLVIFDRIAPAKVDQLLAGMLRDPKMASRGFVPESPSVLQRTPLLVPQDSTRLSFTAPAKPGNYPYVCSVPGHSPTMRGTLRVEQ